MARQQHQLGPQTPRFERRYGDGETPAPGGVNTDIGDVDPTAVPRHQFLQLVNARWDGNVIVSRGGQAKVNDAVLHASGAKLYPVNFEIGTGLRVWMIGAGLPVLSPSTGIYVGQYDPEQCPRMQRVVWYQAATGLAAIGAYGGVPHVVIDTQLRRMQLGKVRWGTEMISLAGASQDLPLGDLPAGFKCNAMIEFDGKLFLGLDDGGANGKVYSWDGKTLREDLTGTRGVKAFGLWRDQLIAGFDATANHIRIRDKGAVPGTWTTVAPGAGTVSTFPGNNAIRSFKDKAYGASGTTTIWSYDGTTLTAAARTIAGAAIEALVEEFGLLIYGYQSSTPTATIGKFDNTTWTDVVKNLTSQVATATRVRGLERYRGTIVAALTPTAASAKLAISPLSDIAGAYEIVSFAGGVAGDIDYLQVI